MGWNLSWHWYSNGQFAKAAEVARKGLGLRPGEAWIRANLALALLRLGDVTGSVEEYERVAARVTDGKELEGIARPDLLDAMSSAPDLAGGREALDVLDRRIAALGGAA